MMLQQGMESHLGYRPCRRSGMRRQPRCMDNGRSRVIQRTFLRTIIEHTGLEEILAGTLLPFLGRARGPGFDLEGRRIDQKEYIEWTQNPSAFSNRCDSSWYR
jgi:hypothetical protein